MLNPPFLLTGSTCLTIRRKTSGTYNADGDYSEGTVSTLSICANVQPNLTRNEMMLLPEGERSKQTLKLYTATPLRMRREGTSGHDADEFDWTDASGDIGTYQVMKTISYQMQILDHCKALCVRKELT